MYGYKEKKSKVNQKQNNTGIPDKMKERIENLSGHSFDDVRVHYNSSKPNTLGALAYTQGNKVFVGPGQEKHLGHELGHVVQQKQGRVKPTIEINGMPVNNDKYLERDADEMAGKIVVQRQAQAAATHARMQATHGGGAVHGRRGQVPAGRRRRQRNQSLAEVYRRLRDGFQRRNGRAPNPAEVAQLKRG